MHKEIYIALSGALMKQMELEVLSENIANSETPGFKARSISFRDYLINEDPEDSRTMTYIESTGLRLTPGPFMKTENKLHIAIEGKGLLSLEGGLYTRRGDLTRTQDGYLVTASGRRVIGEKGAIKLPEGEIEIKEDGGIYVDGNMVDKLRIMEFDDPGILRRAGEGVYEAKSPGKASRSRVLQGYLEESNIDIVREMVKLISTLREFETFQKAIQTLDEAAGKVNNEMARI